MEEKTYCNNCGVMINPYFAKKEDTENDYGYEWICPVCKTDNNYSYEE